MYVLSGIRGATGLPFLDVLPSFSSRPSSVMKSKLIWLLILTSCLFVGCAEVKTRKSYDTYAEFSNFKTFLLGTLPSAGLGGLGLFSGFKKK